MISLWYFVRNSGTHVFWWTQPNFVHFSPPGVFWWTQKPHVFWWTQIKMFPFQNLMSFDGPKTSCALMDPFFVSPPEPLISCLLVDPKGPSKDVSANLFYCHFFFLFQMFAQRVQTQITELLTQSVTILNLLRLLIMMHRLPALQNLEQLNMEENWQNRVHQ